MRTVTVRIPQIYRDMLDKVEGKYKSKFVEEAFDKVIRAFDGQFTLDEMALAWYYSATKKNLKGQSTSKITLSFSEDFMEKMCSEDFVTSQIINFTLFTAHVYQEHGDDRGYASLKKLFVNKKEGKK